MHPKNINPKDFSLNNTDFMYVSHCREGETWANGKLEPYADIPISPGAGVLNYGQGVFEGMKAYLSQDGKKVALFRPLENAKRIAEGCRRLCMPPISQEVFMHGILEVVRANREYIPIYHPESSAQASLYIRPVVWGTGGVLGVKPSPIYTFLVFVSPVGPYFKGGWEPIKLIVTENFHRAMPGGTGNVKAIGNYVPGMLAKENAKHLGFSEVLYLDSQENRYVEEVGAANFFCVKNNVVITPELDGCILPGITRASVLTLAKEEYKLQVQEKRLPIEEAIQADEAFASGTAAVISPIGSISYKGKSYVFNKGNVGPVTKKLYQALIELQHQVKPDPYNWIYEVQ